MNIPEFDDKSLVIMAVIIIACWGAWIMRTDVEAVKLVITSAFSGLFGVAVGKSSAPRK